MLVAAGAALFMDIWGHARTKVPFIPVARNVIREVVSYAPGDSGIFYDLGSGNGSVVREIARAYPNMKSIGIEIAPLPQLLTKILTSKKLHNVRFIFADIRTTSLADATYVFIYLLPHAVRGLEEKLARELPRGCRVVCCDFPLTIKTPRETRKVKGVFDTHTLYVYKF